MGEIADGVTETGTIAENKKDVSRPVLELTLQYAFKSNFLDQEGIMVLTEWLMNTAPRKVLRIIGYSDNRGTDEANERMARLRAHFIKWFIEKYFSHKDLVLSTGQVVIDLPGDRHCKVEVYDTMDKSPGGKVR